MLLYISFIITGLLLFTISLIRLSRKIDYVKSGHRAKGHVVRLEKTEDSEGLYYRPVYEFIAQDGVRMEYRQATASSSPDAWPLGSQRNFIYNPANPEMSARFLNYNLFYSSVLLLGISVALMVIGGGYFLSKYFLTF